jgi:hypothetical protein
MHVSIACAAGAAASTDAVTRVTKGSVLVSLHRPFMSPPYPEGCSTNPDVSSGVGVLEVLFEIDRDHG